MDRKTRALMFVQQQKLMSVSLPSFLKKVEKLDHLYRCAAILHDQDKTANGDLVEPHYHIMMQFDTRVRVSSVARQLGIEQQQLEIMTKQGTSKGIQNGFAYLCHLTTGAQDKYQYSIESVQANFDYQKYIEELQQANESKEVDTVDSILDDYATTLINRREALNRLRNLGGSKLANSRKKLDEIDKANNDILAEKAIQHQKEHPHQRKIIYLYGPAGIGKTTFARKLARKYALKYGQGPNDVAITGSSNDPFEGLKPATVTIWDEMRPTSRLKYEDLLRLFDPNNHEGFLTNSRYHNVMVISSVIIITTPFDPNTMYKHLIDNSLVSQEEDSFLQLARRLTDVYRFSPDLITQMKLKQMGRDYGMYMPTERTIENIYHSFQSAKVEEYDDPLTMMQEVK